MLDLSIIIVNYNKAQFLKQCLESIFDNIAQSLKFEVIVVDNNSQDSSRQILQERFPYVKIIENSRNVGFAKANNQAMFCAQGKYLLLLNNDTFVLAGTIEKMIQFLQENLTGGAVGPALLNADGKTIQAQGSGRGNKFWLAARPISVKFLTGAAFMIRREVYEEVGALDENFFFYNEDLDWCRRIIAKNWKIYYLPQAKIIHYGGQSTKLINEQALIEGFRGGLYFCYKYYRALFIIYRLILLVFCLVQILINILKLLIWSNKLNSFRNLKGFLAILWLDILWKYTFNKRVAELKRGAII
ncbi:MAG: glycosyltransferase family 2 protein [Candidatus Margulisbacteria bacterium]|nr:glycosyltransferase family 2 protein [Candidatus Margulisiibacteriota bacterium]